MRLLSKSRFKLGLECPNKLFYTGNKEFVNSKSDDPFLKALANGGYQVEELAKLHYPNGVTLNSTMSNYAALAEETAELLKQDNVVIYEAAFLFDGLFVRTDILVKEGSRLKIIEVKAKSYDKDDPSFIQKKNPNLLNAKMKSYVLDLTFQYHVVSRCCPNLRVDGYFMMADKSKVACINGMNQLFRINHDGKRIIRETLVHSLSEIKGSVLTEIKMTDLLTRIRGGEFECLEGTNFIHSVEKLKEAYISNIHLNSPISYSKCKNCEFKKTNKDEPGKSGLEYCMLQLGLQEQINIYEPSVWDVWHFNKEGNQLINNRKFLLEQLQKADMEIKSDNKPGLSRSERQWIQIETTQSGLTLPYFEKDELRKEMASWKYPLHFIDFETSAPALPFIEGMHAYESVAFQFSHHILHEDGRVEHAGEFICDEAGVFPNFLLATSLYEELSQDNGTIFRYSHHENTILRHIIRQLENSNFDGKDELIPFLLSITEEKDKQSKIIRKGERSMVDLCHIVQRFFYHPLMKGSNSIKSVLPAILKSSAFLQEKYSQPIGQIGVSSENFSLEHTWIDDLNQKTIDPYKSLPSVYENKTDEELSTYFGDIEEIGNGGAAMTAYGLLQFTDLSSDQRKQLVRSLLKYCELDTLAMVMLVEYFQSEMSKG
jgi:hypothetical protein